MNSTASTKMVWGALLAASLVYCATAIAGGGPAEGTITDGIYHNEKLGWDFPVPRGWKVLSRREIERLEGKGRKTVDEAAGGNVRDNHVALLHLRKSPTATFTSTAQVFDPMKDGNYRDRQEALFSIIANTYRSQGIPTDVRRSTERIDNLDFEVLKLTLYSVNRQKVVLHQLVYDRLMNGRSLLISITYSNHKDGDELLQAVRSSRFTKYR